MNSMATDLNLDLRFDRHLAWWHGDSYRYLVAEITAPSAATTVSGLSHYVAIAIDASPAMDGALLPAAKALAQGVVHRLHESDAVAVVSFAGDSRIEAPLAPADARGKAAATMAIERIVPRPGCNLVDGWLAASEIVAAALEESGDGIAKVMVISQGAADRGLRRSEETAAHAAELRQRGVSTATVAVGPGCDLSLLVAIDDPEGLQQGFAAAGGEDAVEALAADRLELTPPVAQDARLLLTLPPGAKATVIGGSRFETNERTLNYPLGDIRAGARRTIVFKLVLPMGGVGAAAEFPVELHWTAEGGDARRVGPITKTLVYARGRDNTPQQRDRGSSLAVLEQWRLALLRDLISLNRQNRAREAEMHLARELRFIERYAHGLPGAERLMDELRRALPMVHRPWRERQPLTPSARL